MTREIQTFFQRAAARANTFACDENGATMVEYGLMVALIAIVCIAAVSTIGTNLNSIFTEIASDL